MILRTIAALELVEACESCRIINLDGVNDPQTMGRLERFLGRRFIGGSKGYVEFLKAHRIAHLEHGEVLPTEWTENGLTPEVLASIYPPVKKPAFVRRLTDEELAIRELEQVAAPPIVQPNRQDKRPIIDKPLVTKAFAGWED